MFGRGHKITYNKLLVFLLAWHYIWHSLGIKKTSIKNGHLIFVELVHSAFQIYYILLYIFILLIFEFDIETPTKNLILST